MGFKPTQPQKDPGWRMEPPVSEPREAIASPPATAAAEPPDDPPGTRRRSQGFAVGKKAECSVEEPIANSSMLVLPSMTAPAWCSRVITVASSTGMKFSSMRDEQVVRTPLVMIRSLMAMGMPVSGPASSRASASSARAAAARAASGVSVT